MIFSLLDVPRAQEARARARMVHATDRLLQVTFGLLSLPSPHSVLIPPGLKVRDRQSYGRGIEVYGPDVQDLIDIGHDAFYDQWICGKLIFRRTVDNQVRHTRDYISQITSRRRFVALDRG